MTRTLMCAAIVLLLSGVGCDKLMPRSNDQTLPDIATIEKLFEEHGIDATFRYSGNVVEVLVQQPRDQLERGGELWARVGPYIYLFSPATRELIDDYSGVAGVRVITQVRQREVARALLVRDRLNEFGWRRAISLLGQALQDGTRQPATLDRLVKFGEANTQFEYSPNYVAPPTTGA